MLKSCKWKFLYVCPKLKSVLYAYYSIFQGHAANNDVAYCMFNSQNVWISAIKWLQWNIDVRFTAMNENWGLYVKQADVPVKVIELDAQKNVLTYF